MSIFLFMDIDGVIIRHSAGRDPTEQRPWDKSAQVQLGIDPHLMSQIFFKKKFQSVLLGKIDLKHALKEAISEMEVSCTPEDIMNIWFSEDSCIDYDLLHMIDKLVASGAVRAFLATNQEKYRAHYLWENLRLKNHFEDIFFSGEMSLLKINLEYYRNIHKRLGISPTKNQILFFDDGSDNIVVSRSIGWHAFLYRNQEDFFNNPKISSILTPPP